jgi:hypothetical protein
VESFLYANKISRYELILSHKTELSRSFGRAPISGLAACNMEVIEIFDDSDW